MKDGYSARSARSRTQVGATNRLSTLPSPWAADSFRENEGGVASGTHRASRAGAIRPRSTSSSSAAAAAAAAADSSACIAPLRSSRSHDLALVQHSNKASNGSSDKKSLSTSQSMPSLGAPSRAPRVVLGSRGGGEGSPHGGDKSSSRDQAVAKDGTGKQRSYAPEEDSYMSSTQTAYLSGLKPPESKVPVLDPYRYRQLLLDRWINRASKRLGDLASLKYGSIKEFFRSYDHNCDGVLDFDEFSKGITMCQLDDLFPRSLQRTLFDKIDTDKSGSIELDEFIAFMGGAEEPATKAEEPSVWQKQEQRRKSQDPEAQSVQLQPIHDHKNQRIKNKLSHYLNKVVPNASTGLADNRTMFLKKQFAFMSEDTGNPGISLPDIVRAMGPRGMNVGVTEDEVRSLVKEIDAKGDGHVTLNQFASFVNLDDHDPLFQSLFDGRRRNVNLLKSAVDQPPPAETPEEAFLKARADQLHSAAVPSKMLDEAVRMERSKRDPSTSGTHFRASVRPESPAWTVGGDSVTVWAPSGREVVDVWDLPPATRHLSRTKSSLTSSMRSLPRSVADGKDGAGVSFACDGGPFAAVTPQEALWSDKKALSSLSSSQELFSSLEEEQLQAAKASALARTRKVAKSTWADIGHGGIGNDAGTDESSSYYAGPEERFTTTNSERYAPLLKEKKIEKGQRSAGFYRQRQGDSATDASRRQHRSDDRSRKTRAHLERIALSIKTEEVAARLKGERRVRGKARTRLRYNQWVNSMDNWLSDDVPKLADYDRRQFPEQNMRVRGGQQVHEALGGPVAIAV